MKYLEGYIAAPFTPMKRNGELHPEVIPAYADYLVHNGLDGIFICGSTGEGALLDQRERMTVLEKWLEAVRGRLKVVVHTGGPNLKDQQVLAAHAEASGAWAVASMAPSYLPPGRNQELLAYCRAVAEAAPSLPFYYYHIPALSGVHLSVPELLEAAGHEIPNFAGVKYTHPDLMDFEQCRRIHKGRFEILWGLDEMFLDALAYGSSSGVGGTYNHCFKLYHQMLSAYEKGEMEVCRELQYKSHLFVRILQKYRGNIVGGKRIMKFLGIDCGPNRLPLQSISAQEEQSLERELEEIGFHAFCNEQPPK